MLGLRLVNRHNAFMALGFLWRASIERWWVRSMGAEAVNMAMLLCQWEKTGG